MIGPKTRDEVVKIFESLFDENMDAMSDVHEREMELSVAVAIKFGVAGNKGVPVSVQLSFVKEKVKADEKFYINEQQMSLFDSPDIESVTFSAPGTGIDPITVIPAAARAAAEKIRGRGGRLSTGN